MVTSFSTRELSDTFLLFSRYGRMALSMLIKAAGAFMLGVIGCAGSLSTKIIKLLLLAFPLALTVACKESGKYNFEKVNSPTVLVVVFVEIRRSFISKFTFPLLIGKPAAVRKV